MILERKRRGKEMKGEGSRWFKKRRGRKMRGKKMV